MTSNEESAKSHTKDVSSESSCDDYTPAAGDVVEFEYRKTPRKGIAYLDLAEIRILWDYSKTSLFSNDWDGLKGNITNLKKITTTDVLNGVSNRTEAERIYEAYFSNPQPEPVFTGSETVKEKIARLKKETGREYPTEER
jgi:hypothetical protein